MNNFKHKMTKSFAPLGICYSAPEFGRQRKGRKIRRDISLLSSVLELMILEETNRMILLMRGTNRMIFIVQIAITKIEIRTNDS
jgi:hypothetical protein